MVYALSKIIGTAFEPSTLLLLISGVGVVLLIQQRQSRWGRRLVVAGVASFAAIACLPIGTWLIRPLEDRFSPPAPLPERVDGIISLGGAFNTSISEDRGTPALRPSAARVTEFVMLARRYPKAQLVFSGGNGDPFQKAPAEAVVARTFLASLGIAPRRVIFEGASRNTHENALFSYRLVRPAPSQRWLLVTSAADLPRAVGCFRAVGWPVIPVPADYHTARNTFALFPGLATGLKNADWAVHEWIGLFYYRLRGWTTSVFPGPESQEKARAA
jgi:uncharacterized SAM-binding protein YcdF (DUF218 family)